MPVALPSVRVLAPLVGLSLLLLPASSAPVLPRQLDAGGELDVQVATLQRLSEFAGDLMTKLSRKGAMEDALRATTGGGGSGKARHAQTAAMSKLLLDTLGDADPSSSSAMLGAVLGAATRSGAIDSQQATLVSQLLLAIFSTPASLAILSDPTKLTDPKVSLPACEEYPATLD